jgi:hypothetical protein
MQAVTASPFSPWSTSTICPVPEPSSFLTHSTWPVSDTTDQHKTREMHLEPYGHQTGASSCNSLVVPNLDMPMLSTAVEQSFANASTLEQEQIALLMTQTSQMSRDGNQDYHVTNESSFKARMHQDTHGSLGGSTFPTLGVPTWCTAFQYPNVDCSTTQQDYVPHAHTQLTKPSKRVTPCARCWFKKKKVGS